MEQGADERDEGETDGYYDDHYDPAPVGGHPDNGGMISICGLWELTHVHYHDLFELFLSALESCWLGTAEEPEAVVVVGGVVGEVVGDEVVEVVVVGMFWAAPA